MEITCAGAGSFVLKGQRTVVINPIEKADAKIISLHTRRQKDKKLLTNGPGEYEIGGVLITSIALEEEMLHAIEVDGMNVVYLPGDVRKLGERDLTAIGKVDILIVDAGIVKRAQDAITDLSPRVVIPYGAHSVEVCATAGVKDAAPQARFTWNGVTTPIRALVLKSPAARKRTGEKAA